LSIDLVDLVRTARSETIEQICSFVGVTVDQDMCAWFDANVTHESSHAGRWRRDFDADTCAQIDEFYLAACERLVSAGVQLPAGE
jgi:hypothetical protein